MQEYQIIVKKNNRYHQLTKGMISDYKIIKQGFSWQAFLFNILWFLSKKMWSKAITTILFFVIVKFLYVATDLQIVIVFFALIYIGIKANHWQVEFFIKNYDFAKEDIVVAKNAFEAEYLTLKLLIHNYPEQVSHILKLTIEGCEKFSFYKTIASLCYNFYRYLVKITR